jgi:DNA-binding CsgD family transcriptional regulator
MPPTCTSASGEIVSLSARQKQIIALTAQGLKNREMAEALFISVQTVKNHMRRIFEILDVSDRLTLVLWALRNQLDVEAAEPASAFWPRSGVRRL